MKDNVIDNQTFSLKEKVISYIYSAGFGMVLCLMSAALVGGLITGAIMLIKGA